MALVKINGKGFGKAAKGFVLAGEATKQRERASSIPIMIVLTIISFVIFIWGSELFVKEEQTDEEQQKTKMWTRVISGLILLFFIAMIVSSILSLKMWMKAGHKLWTS